MGMRYECRQRTPSGTFLCILHLLPGPLKSLFPTLWTVSLTFGVLIPNPGVVLGSCALPVLSSPAPPLSADHVSVSMELRFEAPS